MAENNDQALNIAIMFTQCALDSTNELKRQLAALRRILALCRHPNIAGGIGDADLLSLMELSVGLLELQGEGLAAHHMRQAVDAYNRRRMRFAPNDDPL